MGKKIEGGGTKEPVLRPNMQVTVTPNKNTEKNGTGNQKE